MPFVLAVQMTAKEGEEEMLRDWLVKITALTRKEPGCLSFLLHQDPAEPRKFFIYEQFVDRDAHAAHLQTDHFHEIAEVEIMPRVEFELRELELLEA